MADKETSLGDVIDKLKDIENLVKARNKTSKDTDEESSKLTLKAFNGLGGTIKNSLGDLKISITAPFTKLGNSIGDLKSSITKPFSSLKQTIKDSLGDLKSSITAPFTKLGNSIKDSLGNLKSSITAPFRSLKENISSPFKGIKSAVTSPYEFLKKGFTGTSNFFKKKNKPADKNDSEDTKKQKPIDKKPETSKGGLSTGLIKGFAAIGEGFGKAIKMLLVGIGEGFIHMGKNITKIVKGAAALAILGASLIPAAYAMKKFSESVNWEGVAMASVALLGLVATVAALGAIMSTGVGAVGILAGAAALAMIGASLIPAAIGFEIFSKAMNQYFVPAMNGFADVIDKVVNTALGYIEGLAQVFTDTFDAISVSVSNFIESFVDQIVRLEGLDTATLALLGPALMSLSAGILAFGVGSGIGAAISGFGEFVGGLFGGKSPIEKILSLAAEASKIAFVGKTLEGLPKALNGFADISADTDGLNDILDFTDDLYDLFDKRDFANNFIKGGDAVRDMLWKITKQLNELDGEKLMNIKTILTTDGSEINAEQQELLEKRVQLNSQSAGAAQGGTNIIDSRNVTNSTNVTNTYIAPQKLEERTSSMTFAY